MQIFPVYKQSDSSEEVSTTEFKNLATDRYLPPTCAESALHDDNFIKTSARDEDAFLLDLKVMKMESAHFYEFHIVPLIMREDTSDALRNMAVSNVLVSSSISLFS